MWKIEREVELKWQQATIKNDLIFTWLFFENKKLTLRLLQIILPELNIKKVGDTQRENNQKKNKIYRGVMKKVGLMTLRCRSPITTI